MKLVGRINSIMKAFCTKEKFILIKQLYLYQIKMTVYCKKSIWPVILHYIVSLLHFLTKKTKCCNNVKKCITYHWDHRCDEYEDSTYHADEHLTQEAGDHDLTQVP